MRKLTILHQNKVKMRKQSAKAAMLLSVLLARMCVSTALIFVAVACDNGAKHNCSYSFYNHFNKGIIANVQFRDVFTALRCIFKVLTLA